MVYSLCGPFCYATAIFWPMEKPAEAEVAEEGEAPDLHPLNLAQNGVAYTSGGVGGGGVRF